MAGTDRLGTRTFVVVSSSLGLAAAGTAATSVIASTVAVVDLVTSSVVLVACIAFVASATARSTTAD